MIDQSLTKIVKALENFRNMPPANMDAIINILLRVSEMICALPNIQEMDINPIIVNDKNAIAVDVRIVIQKSTSLIPYYHMAIHPYPDYLISTIEVDKTQITLRPLYNHDELSKIDVA